MLTCLHHVHAHVTTWTQDDDSTWCWGLFHFLGSCILADAICDTKPQSSSTSLHCDRTLDWIFVSKVVKVTTIRQPVVG
jgi:hypothetical protein